MASPPPGPIGTSDARQDFETAFDFLQAEISNAGAIAAMDGAARAQYDRLLREFRNDLLDRVNKGQITWREAAQQARHMRDDVMQVLRQRSTPVGRALAEALKPQSPTLNALIARKTVELFGREADFTRLSLAQRHQVYAAIVESAGKSNPRITARMRTVSRAGRGLLVLSLALSVYTVATAEDKAAAVVHEGAITGAGIAGGLAGGALAGLACGPGAPVCVTVGAFIGGATAALGVDFFWSD
ncbi:hypothetical protein HHL10_11370 [Azohydromonas sp. G-1-1-14]|uniref:Uncharacterized protein n=2 Tax=Azohydromonas caseinilytica TaxID=2728836 RepID=A0A848F8L6_9BURK|nr:hypothetical protein [Azohydromonas caseinilytica]